ncbi:MAG: VWA domain-containing protein, partial [Anaerolineales bacterium]|nr:VWA domain-containing protein [Anaerolineales bacterium]
MRRSKQPKRDYPRRYRGILNQINQGSQKEKGQAIVITAVAFLAMLAFTGLVTDAGTLYLNFTRLKRGLDAAAVAAANNIKDSSLPVDQRNANIRESAREMLALNDIEDIYSLETYTCDDAGLPANFASLCPAPGENKRKLAWVQATQESPVYFLQLFGVENVSLTTHSVGEAASIDVVLVIDTSESMGSSTPGYDANFNPSACNTANDCQPLRQAKDAAKSMIDKLFDGYDRIAIVTYDFSATIHDPDLATITVLESDHTAVKSTIDAIALHDDLDLNTIIATGKNPINGELNPIDVNNDGTYPGGIPTGFGDAIVSTCTGCGMRIAGNILSDQGRIDSVWIIVLLSDGATNVSDLPDSSDVNNPVPAGYINGFCGGDPGFPSPNRMWDQPWCTDSDPSTRHCGPFHADASECPPGSTWVGNNTPPYDVEDYARDITDRVGLLFSANINEPTGGEEIAIYTIGLGVAASPPDYDGEVMLRYMANIGDDNIRNPVPDIVADSYPPDPCDGVAVQTSCGQYYYAPSATYLT